MTTPKRGRGRPAVTIDLKEAMALAYFGHTDEEIALILGIARSTLALYKKKHPDFSDSLKGAKLKADLVVTKSLYSRAAGGDVTAGIFWLKNRQPEKWKDRQDHRLAGAGEDGAIRIEVVHINKKANGNGNGNGNGKGSGE